MNTIENRIVEYQLGLIRRYLSEIVDTVEYQNGMMKKIEEIERIVDMMELKVIGKKMKIEDIDMTVVGKKLELLKRKI